MSNKQKIVVVGDGAVGSSCAYALTLLGIGRELGIIDVNKNKPVGDALDLNSVLAYHPAKKIYACEYSDCGDADIIVMTAGAPQKPGETRLDLVNKNLKITHDIVTEIMKSGFDGIFVVAANPVDILTYAIQKWSGLPANRVFGSGTSLDSARFQDEISRYLGVDARSVQAYILGEHGDSSFAAWSATKVGGTSAKEAILEKGGETALTEIYENVRDVAYKIINAKGATYYGIAASLAEICRHILADSKYILPVSAYLDGEYDVKDLYTGTPAVIGKDGVEKIIEVPLTEEEQEKMKISEKALRDTLDSGMEYMDSVLN